MVVGGCTDASPAQVQKQLDARVMKYFENEGKESWEAVYAMRTPSFNNSDPLKLFE